jgi:hypothetical protein
MHAKPRFSPIKLKDEFCDHCHKNYIHTHPTTDRVARNRRRETFQLAQKVHGGSPKQTAPAEVELIDTVIKKCKPSLVAEMVTSNRRILKEFIKIMKKVKKNEETEENKIKSVAVYYSAGVMGKRKYRKVYGKIYP